MIGNKKSKQHGLVVVEFVFVSIIMFTLIFFTGDMAYKLGMKGRLDRLSYSAVNLMKEQTALSEDYTFSAENIFKIIRNSLYRTTSQGGFDADNLVVLIETLTTTASGNGIATADVSDVYSNTVIADSPLENGDTPLKDYVDSLATDSVTETDEDGNDETITITLAPYLESGEYADIYQVSVCYKTENWYGEYIDTLNGTNGSSFEWVCSNSIAFER